MIIELEEARLKLRGLKNDVNELGQSLKIKTLETKT